MLISISLKKTEVVTFVAAGRRRPRGVWPVRIGSDIVPSAQCFKYLGVTISANGDISTHQQAMFSKAKVSAFEVAKLMRKLEITDLGRLRTYLQCFVVEEDFCLLTLQSSLWYGKEPDLRSLPRHASLVHALEETCLILQKSADTRPGLCPWSLFVWYVPFLPGQAIMVLSAWTNVQNDWCGPPW